MRTQMITACCVLSLANFAVAANPTHRLRPNDADALKAARINVSCRILNGTDYAFEISAGVPQGFDSLDASFSVRNDKGLVTYTSWSSSLAVNLPSIQQVRILLEGREAETLAGHADLSRAYTPDPSWVEPTLPNPDR